MRCRPCPSDSRSLRAVSCISDSHPVRASSTRVTSPSKTSPRSASCRPRPASLARSSTSPTGGVGARRDRERGRRAGRVPARLEGRRGADAGPGPKVHVDPRLRARPEGSDHDRPESSRDARLPEEKLVGADRVIAVLTELADHPSASRSRARRQAPQLEADRHRALATLRRAGLADMTGRGSTSSATNICGSPSATSTAGPDRPHPTASRTARRPVRRDDALRGSRAKTSSTGPRWIPRKGPSGSRR